IDGIGDEGAAAVAGVLGANMVEIATVHSTRFTRTLMELADRELRHRVLQLLVELAVADDRLTHDEVKVLRQLTAALGLEQGDYNATQPQHRERLRVLRLSPSHFPSKKCEGRRPRGERRPFFSRRFSINPP